MGKLEFSKWLLVGSYGVMFILTGFALVIFTFGYDIQGLIPIVLASWAEVATVNMFYMKKARVENKIKIINSLEPHVLENLHAVKDLFD